MRGQGEAGLLDGPRLNGWPLLGWSGVALVAQIGLGLGLFGTGEEGLRVCARGTLRIGLVLFIGALVASSVQQVFGGPFSSWLLRNRRQLGFSFGVAHFFHIGFIILLDRAGFIPADRDIFREGGTVIYAFIGLMMLTSFDATARPLPRWLWKLLHKAGLYAVWVAFTAAYVGRVADGELFYVPFAGSLLIGMALRWWVGAGPLLAGRSAAET